jgi:hypothetical protein
VNLPSDLYRCTKITAKRTKTENRPEKSKAFRFFWKSNFEHVTFCLKRRVGNTCVFAMKQIRQLPRQHSRARTLFLENASVRGLTFFSPPNT